MMAHRFARQELGRLMAYRLDRFENCIKLDQNENPFPFPPELKSELYREFESLEFARYVDASQAETRSALAEYLRVDPSMVVLGNGSDELINLTLTAFARPGTRVVIPSPTFPTFRKMPVVHGNDLIEVPLRGEEFQLDFGEIREAVRDVEFAIVFIVNPNNPTGNLLPREDLVRLAYDPKILLVVDEAYYEFSGVSLIDLVRERDNVMIFRTFSKAFGLAGLRVGYAVACSDIISELNRVRLPFNVNSFSQAVARLVLRHAVLYKTQAETIVRERERVFTAMSKIPHVRAYPSHANFILFRVPDADAVWKGLLERGIVVRNVSGERGLKGCLRVSIGLPEENDAFIEALKLVLG